MTFPLFLEFHLAYNNFDEFIKISNQVREKQITQLIASH